MSTKYKLQRGMWVYSPNHRESFYINAMNEDLVAGDDNNGRQILCERRYAERRHPPIQKPQHEPEPLINHDWIRNPPPTTGVTYVNSTPYTTVYNVSTASS